MTAATEEPDNVSVVIGELFDSDADYVIVPCDTDGNVDRRLVDELRLLGFRAPGQALMLGEIVVQRPRTTGHRWRGVIFAAVVGEGGATAAAVEAAAREIADIPEPDEILAAPPIGAGIDGLSATQAVNALLAGFLKARSATRLVLYVRDLDLYDEVRVALPWEPLISASTPVRVMLALGVGTRPDPDAGDVLAALLIWGAGPGHKGAAAAVVRAIDATGVNPRRVWESRYDAPAPPSTGQIDNARLAELRSRPRFKRVFTTACSYASRTTRRPVVHQRHLLAAALAETAREDDPVLALLSVPVVELRALLRAEVAQNNSTDSAREWDAILGASAEVVLVGAVSSDHVPWDEPLDDRLGVQNDVGMLATLVAATTTPLPLSIGLFGEWGSGKSFFMGLMQQQIKRLSEQAATDRDSGMCRSIVQIRFNAWHYADANLWASLAVQVFSALAGFGQPPDPTTRLRQDLLKQLDTYQELLSSKQDERDRAGDRLAEATAKHDAAEARLADAEHEWTAAQTGDLIGALAADPAMTSVLEQIGAKAEQLGVVTPADAADLRRAAAEVQAMTVDLPALFRIAGRTQPRVLAIVLAAGVLLVGGTVLLVTSWPVAVLASVAGALVAAAGPLSAALGQVRRLAGYLTAGLRRAEEIQAAEAEKRRAAVALLAAKVEAAQAELDRLTDEVAAAEAEQQRLQRDVDELAPDRQLYRFIAERSASDDYQRQLGVVSMVRRDFETLTRRLRGARATSADAGPPVDRIVLYIDDLDRCQPAQVVRVLEAVHLLLAMDLFVVVVGVDPRWLLRSLSSVYTPLAEADGSYWRSTPQDYLEKIFQVPFVLPGMTPAGFSGIVAHYAPAGSSPGQDIRPVLVEDRADEQQPAEPGPAARTVDVETESAVDRIAAGVPPLSLVLTGYEIDFLGRLAPLVRTPRAAKRMLNIYQMLRTTRNLGSASQFLGRDGRPGEYQAVAQLIGVLTAFPELFGPLCWGAAGGRPLVRWEGGWNGFIDALAPREQEGEWHSTVAGPLEPGEVADWQRLAAQLRALRPAVLLYDIEPYRRWAPQIGRFSFLLSPYAADF